MAATKEKPVSPPAATDGAVRLLPETPLLHVTSQVKFLRLVDLIPSNESKIGMEGLVASDMMSELNQILSNLVLGDNDIRREAERLLNEKWLTTQPEAVLLALAQLASQAPDDHMRSFSAVLLRRILFRPLPTSSVSASSGSSTIYDHISEPTRNNIEKALLHCLKEESDESVRKKVVDTITDVALGSLERGRPWPELQQTAFECTQSPTKGHRESAFRIFASVPYLLLDQQPTLVLPLLERGLKDPESIEVRHAALRASSAFLSSSDPMTQSQSVGLMYPMLYTLPPLTQAQLPPFLRTLIPLSTSHPNLFRAHLPSLLTYLCPLILSPPPSFITEATPTQAHSQSFVFPPTPTAGNPHAHIWPPPNSHSHSSQPSSSSSSSSKSSQSQPPTEEEEERDQVRKAALELLISISEAKPAMAKACSGWVAGVVRCCLEGMAEIRDEGGAATARWLDVDDPNDDDDDYGYSHVFEESIDRLACCMAACEGGKTLLPIAFQYIPALLASPDWMQRHAGLMAIAAVAEGTSKIMEKELGKVVSLVTPLFQDPHPRVRYAACQCIGQLCTDLEETIQERYHQEIFNALIPTLRAPEPRVHSHAAAAIINFCTGVDSDTLQPYLDDLVNSLLAMLRADSKKYVQEQAITTLAMVADASADTFRKYYTLIMPNLLNVLRTATDPGLRILRCKVMECAGLIAIAVGRETFKADASQLAELLMQIQNNVTDPGDLTAHYLISTWAKVCQALGTLFEPYLPFVMPPLLRAAAVKPDVTLVDGDDAPRDQEVVEMDGKQIGIRTSALEEKCNAFDVLLTHCATLGPKFGPYMVETLNLALPGLKFFFHDGVREACAMIIPVLVVCGKESNTLTPDLINTIFSQLISVISTEGDSSFLASLCKCFTDSLRVVQREALAPEFVEGIIKATQGQLHLLAQKRRGRLERAHGKDWEEEKEDIMLMEEMEDFALEEITRLLEFFDRENPLLVAVGSIKDLGIRTEAWDTEDEEEGEEEP